MTWLTRGQRLLINSRWVWAHDVFYWFVEVFGQFGKFHFQLKMSSKSLDIQNRVVQNHFQELKFKHNKVNNINKKKNTTCISFKQIMSSSLKVNSFLRKSCSFISKINKICSIQKFLYLTFIKTWGYLSLYIYFHICRCYSIRKS